MSTPIDPFENGIPRRRLLKASAATGATAATATAGCLGEDEATDSTIFVFNTGDMTVSMIDPSTDELLRSEYLGATASWPSNQYASVNPEVSTLWLNVEGGIYGFSIEDQFQHIADIETGSSSNWQELTPDGTQLVVSAREPAHTHYRIDADPESETFGTITGEIARSEETESGPGPCDITFGSDGEFSYCPDVRADTITVLRTDPFEIAAQIDVEPLGNDAVVPFMATASWDGHHLAVENREGETGTESVFDVSDPESPEEIHRFTAAEGLGDGPTTSEWGPDSEILYVFTDGVTIIDVPGREVIETIDVGGAVRTGTWDPDRTKLYVPVQENNEVKVIDHESFDVVATVGVGNSPRSATARAIRPNSNTQARLMAALSSVGITFDGAKTTYCEEECHCGRFC